MVDTSSVEATRNTRLCNILDCFRIKAPWPWSLEDQVSKSLRSPEYVISQRSSSCKCGGTINNGRVLFDISWQTLSICPRAFFRGHARWRRGQPGSGSPGMRPPRQARVGFWAEQWRRMPHLNKLTLVWFWCNVDNWVNPPLVSLTDTR